MAPANGSNGSGDNVAIRKAGAARHRNVTPVVPAIPLPYMQKRLQKQLVSKTPSPVPAPAPMPESSPPEVRGDIPAAPNGTQIQPTEPEVAELDHSKEVKKSVVASPGAVAESSSAQGKPPFLS